MSSITGHASLPEGKRTTFVHNISHCGAPKIVEFSMSPIPALNSLLKPPVAEMRRLLLILAHNPLFRTISVPASISPLRSKTSLKKLAAMKIKLRCDFDLQVHLHSSGPRSTIGSQYLISPTIQATNTCLGDLISAAGLAVLLIMPNLDSGWEVDDNTNEKDVESNTRGEDRAYEPYHEISSEEQLDAVEEGLN